MANRSKRVRTFREQVDRNAIVPIDEALSSLKGLSSAKFDESVDVSVQPWRRPQEIGPGGTRLDRNA